MGPDVEHYGEHDLSASEDAQRPSEQSERVDILVMRNLDKIDRFPVGRAFATREKGSPVRFGWITGYAHNPADELVFRARWAHMDAETLIHPANVHHVCSFVDA